MARIRTIKPEFWTSEQVMECSPNARLLFIGLWNFCDDCGRMTYSLKKIKAQIFPSDDFTAENIHGMLLELSTNDLIGFYAIENEEYLFVTGWHHQRIDKPQKSKIPAPPQDHSKTILGTFDVGMDLKGKEGKGKEGKRLSSDADASAGDDLGLVGGGYAANGRSRKPEKRDELEDEFAAWWLAYPKREAKGQARKAYAAARKKVSAEALLTAAQRAATLYASTEQKFIPFPATWLNGERWLDEIAARDPPANAYTTGRSI